MQAFFGMQPRCFRHGEKKRIEIFFYLEISSAYCATATLPASFSIQSVLLSSMKNCCRPASLGDCLQAAEQMTMTAAGAAAAAAGAAGGECFWLTAAPTDARRRWWMTSSSTGRWCSSLGQIERWDGWMDWWMERERKRERERERDAACQNDMLLYSCFIHSPIILDLCWFYALYINIMSFILITCRLLSSGENNFSYPSVKRISHQRPVCADGTKGSNSHAIRNFRETKVHFTKSVANKKRLPFWLDLYFDLIKSQS